MEEGSVDKHAHPQCSKIRPDDHSGQLHGLGILYLQESGEDEGRRKEAVEKDLQEL